MSPFSLVFYVAVGFTALLGATAAPMQPRELGYKDLQEKYCNDPDFHCLYINENIDAPTFESESGAEVYHAYGQKSDINLYVVENPQHGTITADCGGEAPSKATYRLSNKVGSYIEVQEGSLNAYFKSAVGKKIPADGRLESNVEGDDLVVYCPAE
ncbi:unnamed protein product [Sympodiomycopsis kandeliae]